MSTKKRGRDECPVCFESKKLDGPSNHKNSACAHAVCLECGAELAKKRLSACVLCRADWTEYLQAAFPKKWNAAKCCVDCSQIREKLGDCSKCAKPVCAECDKGHCTFNGCDIFLCAGCARQEMETQFKDITTQCEACEEMFCLHCVQDARFIMCWHCYRSVCFACSAGCDNDCGEFACLECCREEDNHTFCSEECMEEFEV
jgi:hypothetical protein